MKDYTIDYKRNYLEVKTGFGNEKLDLGRPATEEDAKTLERMMNLGAQMYADQVRRARFAVDDLINWRVSC